MERKEREEGEWKGKLKEVQKGGGITAVQIEKGGEGREAELAGDGREEGLSNRESGERQKNKKLIS